VTRSGATRSCLLPSEDSAANREFSARVRGCSVGAENPLALFVEEVRGDDPELAGYLRIE
jgi:hypothetical protein